jgi:hypothetical protein
MSTTSFLDELNDEREAWKADHDAAMLCFDLEDTVLRGVTLFYMVRRADESWTKKVQAGSVAFDIAKAREIHEKYKWWLAPCDNVLDALTRAERSIRTIDNAEVFRQCVRYARRAVLINIEGLAEAAAQIARGEVEPITEADLGGDKAQLVA